MKDGTKEPNKEPDGWISSLENWIDEETSESIKGTNDHPSFMDEADCSVLASQLVAHSLLISHFETTQSRERRIESTLDAFDRGSTIELSRDRIKRGRKWFVVTMTAAAFLLMLGVWGLLTPGRAEAALGRVIAAAQLPVTRVYQTNIQTRILGRDVVRKATLYSRSIDRFAAEFQRMRGQSPLWIGSDGQQRWLVAGERHWDSADAADLPRDLLLDRITLRNLQFNALLTQIPDAFDVRLLPGESILIEGLSFDCEPIEATPRRKDSGLPDVIRIWPDPDTGVVLQMHVIKNETHLRNARRIELQWSGEQEVSEEFFSPKWHQDRETSKR